MSAAWTLAWTPPPVGGVSETIAKTLAEWGIDACTLTRRSQASDTLDFSIPMTSSELDLDDLFTHQSTVELYNPAGVRWFVGRMLDPQPEEEGASAHKSFTAAGPYYWAENLPATQLWVEAGKEGGKEFGRCLLFSVWGADAKISQRSTSDEIELFTDKLIAAGAPWRRGTIDGGVVVPSEKVESLTFGAVFTRILRYTPDAVTWFDYSTGAPLAPLFHCRRQPDLEAVTIDVSDGTRVQQWTASKNLEGRPPRVVVTMKRQTDPGGGTVLKTDFVSATWPAGAAGPQLGELHVSMDYTEDYKESPALTLAEALYAQGQNLGWHGNIELLEDDCTGVLRPGHRLNLSGTRMATADMGAIVQETQEDIFSGTTHATFGPPGQIGPEDLLQLLLPHRIRTRVAPQEVQERDTGESPSNSKNYGMGEKEDETRATGIKVRMFVEDGVGGVAVRTVQLPKGAKLV